MSMLGKLLGGVCALAGVLDISLTVPLVVSKFIEVRGQRLQKQEISGEGVLREYSDTNPVT